MPTIFASAEDPSIPVHAMEEAGCASALAALPRQARNWAEHIGFSARLGDTLPVPGEDGRVAMVLIGLGSAEARARKRFGAVANLSVLPAGTYHIASALPLPLLEEMTLGWLLSSYGYDRYAGKPAPERALKQPEGIDAKRMDAIVAGEFLTRDLINTPANDMGPDELEAAVLALSLEFGADVSAIRGEELLEQNFPLIHAVGRASPRAPRLLDLRWGSQGPALTLVGKGVCFDTGGLNLKPGSSMALMKKDMGGAATVLGLASMIMALDMPIRLRVLIPAVENAVSGPAFRPGDILTARNGLTVEINNTDAEGRLVLADALSLATEEKPDLLVSMATLTGAARVAVGPDLAPFYSTQDDFAEALSTAAAEVLDPVWRMPFWAPYEALIEPGIADLDNAPSGGFAGSITAALFLRRFAATAPSYAHFDIYGWQPAAAPARPKGGVGQGARALLAALPKALGL
ncbi:putative cytosol aminopeptidase [Pseudoruegeria aquimaris]|uniref:Putative cytosol aminopeptidase n=1 Tax=Pseudoruegeria aquimaris TaxID=393663 RepID=A0A1Y5RZ04_9RHOB|nr:leucyl aminopeptidase family protein [Pseudoruegeria aquimaris]SLN28512.1 putative cytosol aminopeptidase [Pseudoruegeria aquimaris]